MDLTLVSIIVLAALVFILSGMVGYLYWQQTRLMQSVQSLALAFTSHLAPPALEPVAELATEQVETEDVQEAEIAEDDDRVSVEQGLEETIEHVEEAPRVAETHDDDIDDYQSKTAKQLREILSKRGIPFGKSDSKSALIELLKATA